MRALLFDGTPRYVTDYPVPVPKEQDSLVRVLYAAVCNTDKEILKGYRGFRGVMGHEFVGIVERSANQALIGKTVAGEINSFCGNCLYCRTGRERHCINGTVLGIYGMDGCFAEYLSLQTSLLHPIPDGLPAETALFAEPFAAALEILEQVHIAPSTSVAIIGDGRLAYMIAQAVALTGADLTIIGRHLEKLGAFSGFAHTAVEGAADTDGYEIVVDACGSPGGILAAKQLVRRKGTIVLKSTYGVDASINLSSFVVDEITVVSSRCGPFEPALRLLSRGLIQLPQIEFHDLADYEKAFSSSAFKAGFSIGSSTVSHCH